MVSSLHNDSKRTRIRQGLCSTQARAQKTIGNTTSIDVEHKQGLFTDITGLCHAGPSCWLYNLFGTVKSGFCIGINNRFVV